jgi:hypothetical protein
MTGRAVQVRIHAMRHSSQCQLAASSAAIGIMTLASPA